MYLIYDTETTGLPKNYNAPLTDSDNWPRLVQLAWQLHGKDGALIEAGNLIVKPDGFDIPFVSAQIHGITTEKAMAEGQPLDEVLAEFDKVLAKTEVLAGHNIEFDIAIVGAEHHRLRGEEHLTAFPSLDTKNESTEFCAIPGGRGGKFKWPKLGELHQKLFNEDFDEAHNAAADVAATARCFFELIRLKVISSEKAMLSADEAQHFQAVNPTPFEPAEVDVGVQVGAVKEKSVKKEKVKAGEINHDFAHLHCHSQYSVLQATCRIDNIIARSVEYGMPGVALTDLANMYAAYKFMASVERQNKKIAAQNELIEKGEAEGTIKPAFKGVLGCEFYLTDDLTDRTRQNNGFQSVLLAKNVAGYQNLAKLSSISFLDGFYYVPRIDRDSLVQYKSDLIATTGGLGGEIPSLILNVGEKQAEEAFVWWKEQFGDDFYAELIDHGLPEEKHVNETLLRFCETHGVKYFASNNVYYLEQKDAEAQKILMCVKENARLNEQSRSLEYIERQFPNDQFYLKSQEEMKAIFPDKPEAFASITEILDKCENYNLQRDVLLPEFDIPEEFIDAEDKADGGKRGENAYLRHLTYEGAKERYGGITDEIKERLDFELDTIAMTGYPGYFLIVQDFTRQAREMGVWVGPGRGSAAGSAVAYCTGITNVDPIKYDLLFERFLNPDRVSLPDIDIDFDDRGRDKVIEWVVNKYGRSQVAQITTYGTMAAKSAIRDASRVLDLPLDQADKLAKLIPDVSLGKLFGMPDAELNKKLGDAEKIAMADELKKISKETSDQSTVLNRAQVIEGSVRNLGIHACGVIITPEDMSNLVPIKNVKDSILAATQFDNSVVEDAGLLKMDFLGLKTLTLIKDAIENVKLGHGVDIDPDEIPLDDEKTYELFQAGKTVGIFQFESPGMQKHLKDLKPDQFADLIAMNALYRPGPMEYIPNFIARKHGREEVEYDLEAMEGHLKETHGITVYQEQVMLLSQKLANFTKGEADTLRKAMGKKKIDLLAKMKPKFLQQGEGNGHDPKILEKVWKDWEAFASYAFNKSHSTCYAFLAVQSGYLKANYPAEFMASVLSNNMNDIKSVTFFMDECKRMGVPVLGPDVNESRYRFAVNDKGEIRFGLGAVKGVGAGAVEAIINEREENGPYTSIFDICKRVDLRSANRKCLESLAYAGGFDSFGEAHRAQYFVEEGETTFIDKVVKYGAKHQESLNSSQVSLFGEGSEVQIEEPSLPQSEPWGSLQELNKEKEMIGVYISGHPLDTHRLAIDSFNHVGLGKFKTIEPKAGIEVRVAGLVTACRHRMSKNQKPYGELVIEDYEDSHELRIFGDTYAKFKGYFIEGVSLSIKGVFEKPWRDAEKLDFKIKTMEFLSEMLEKNTSKITLTLPLEAIQNKSTERLQTLLSAHPGKCRVAFRVIGSDKQEISLMASKLRVRPDQELVSGLRDELNLDVAMS